MKDVVRSLISELMVYPRLVARVFPLVRRELGMWKRRAGCIPDGELRKQALASISSKAFHCMGGSVLALLNPPHLRKLVKAIVAVQTVSDYLDNLCDRATVSSTWANDPSMDAACKGFVACMSIHEAFRCAVDPTRPLAPFYRLYPAEHPEGDGGYLDALVEESRGVLRDLPSYNAALPRVNYLAGLYCELQSIKHLSPAIRGGLMEEWHRARWVGDLRPDECSLPLPEIVSQGLSPLGEEGDCRASAPYRSNARHDDTVNAGSTDLGIGRITLPWWEFAAATGSTLGIFALLCASSWPQDTPRDPGASRDIPRTPGPNEKAEYGVPAGPRFPAASSDTSRTTRRAEHLSDLFSAYFPFISGLHILLDYYIDREEDRLGGDLNFVSAYPSPEARVAGLLKFVDRSLDAASNLPRAWLHLAVVRGLLAMYLSDPKVRATGISSEARELARRGGPLVRALLFACGLVRKVVGF